MRRDETLYAGKEPGSEVEERDEIALVHLSARLVTDVPSGSKTRASELSPVVLSQAHHDPRQR